MLGAADPAGVGAETVESRLLVLILSVLQGLSEKSRDRDLGWKAVAILASHVCGDPGVVGRRMRVRLGGQASPRGLIERALVEHAKNLGVSLRPHDHDDRLVILGCRPDHRRTTDVDLLDGLIKSDVGTQHCVDKRVEVAADQVDLPEPVLGQSVDVFALVPPGKDARMHARVQRLDPAVHHLGEAGEVADRLRVERRILEGLQSAAGREQVVVQPLEAAGKACEPGLVANGQ